jgi:hypothetical protein
MTWVFVVLCVLLCLLVYLGVAAVIVLWGFWRAICQTKRKKPPRTTAPTELQCFPIPGPIYRRPDPCIYSQQYLMSQGLSVTWQNPDVHLELGGVTVDSTDLLPNTTYDVVARIWNNSIDAPAVNMAVNYSFLSFGIQTVQTYIGTTHVNLPVKGAPGEPTFGHQNWTTPSTPGHFCLIIELIWADDANPLNNVGQHNTLVKPLNSPHASFTFPVRNPGRERVTLNLQMDAYPPPQAPKCGDQQPATTRQLTREELLEHRREALALHGLGNFPIPPGWQVVLDHPLLHLGPGEQQDVTVDITAPDGFTGRQSFNVNAFQDNVLVGGVTLNVKG